MDDTTRGTADAVPSAWLDVGCTTTSGTLNGGKANPPPPPPIDPSIINGTNGDDTLQGSAGDNQLYGGKGVDTAVYRGTLDQYELSFSPTEGYKLIDKISGRDGSDLLYSIERLQFDGIEVLLDGQGGAQLADGTQLLAPYVPPPPPPPPPLPEGWEPIFSIMPIEHGGDFVIGIDDVIGEPFTASWVAVSNADNIELNGIATLAAYVPLADA